MDFFRIGKEDRRLKPRAVHSQGVSHEASNNEDDDSGSSSVSNHSHEHDDLTATYESEKYLSGLVLAEERNPRWRSRNPRTPLEKAVFLWSISMGHIVDGLNHEYDKIAESETTDGPQLLRIRQLLQGACCLVFVLCPG